MGWNGHKGSRTDVNRCDKHEWAQKYPLVSKFLRNQGVLAVLTRKGTAIPSSANKKRDSLSTVSLVGEAGLESVLCQPLCIRSTGKDRLCCVFRRPLADQTPQKRCCKSCKKLKPSGLSSPVSASPCPASF